MANQQHLMNESDLPKDLEFIQREPLIAGSAAPPVQQGVDRYQGAILSAPLGLDTDIAHSQLPGANPAYRLMPASIAGNPASNASIQSTAAKTIAVTPGPSTSVSAEIELIMPSIFSPVDQTVTLPGPLSVALAAEPSNTFFKTGGPGLSGFEALAQASATSASLLNFSVTATPITASTFGLFFGMSNDSWSVASGWTAVPGGGDNATWYRSISGTSPVTVADSFGTSGSAIGSLAIFNGPAPSFVQSRQAATQSGTLAFTSNNTAGNMLLVVMQCFDFSGNFYGLSASDSNGNLYQQIVTQQFPAVGANPSLQQAVFIVTNCVGGANTVTFNYSGKAGIGPVYTTTIVEFGPLPSGSSIPFFGFLTATDIPPINLNSSGNGGAVGVLPVVKGGTGVTSSTGTGNTVLSASPTFTGTVAAASMTMSGLLGTYNGITTVSNGIPSEIATIDRTNQSANIGATTLFAVGASGQQMYRVSAYVVCTTPDGASSTLPNVQIVYTDFDSNTSVTLDATPILAGAGLGQTAALTNNTAGTLASGVVVINPKASTTIQYQTVNYASGTPATMKYALHIKLEAM